MIIIIIIIIFIIIIFIFIKITTAIIIIIVFTINTSFIGRDNILKVATNETSTLHLTICTWIELENYYNNDQQFNSHDFH